jgi:hypothetical protein
MIARAYLGIDGPSAKSVARFFWKLLRLPILAVLLLCEPIVEFVCAAMMLLSVLVAVVLKASAIGLHFPMMGMVVFAASFGVLLFLYHGLIALLLNGD